MEVIAVKAAGWVVGKALGAVSGTLLEAWAASKGLGLKVDALKVELLYAQAMLENAQGREIHSTALKELLFRLQQLAYCADDVLDEIDYFRIQDELDGTYDAADAHAGGCVRDLIQNARHVARDVAAKLKPSCGSRHTIRGEHDEQDSNSKHGCLSSIVCCSCGRGTVSSSPSSPTNQQDEQNKVHGGCMQKLACNGASTAACPGNGRGSFSCAVLPSKVKGCLCGKREMMSSSPSSPTTNQCEKKNPCCGCLLKVTPTACDTAKSVGKFLPCFSFQSVDGDSDSRMSESDKSDILEKEKRFLCGAWTASKAQQRKHTDEQAPKLKFNRVAISEKMGEITEHLKYVCAKVSNVLNLEFMGTSRSTRKDLANKRPITTSDITDTELYGRDTQKKNIVDGIINGKYFANNDELVVLPIVGPGGIGKTTFTQHVYAELKSHFDVTIWICVSLNFTASRLAQEAVKQIPSVDGEKKNGSDQELIEQRLKAKRFLFVLDDMWACLEDEWDKLLAPFRRGGQKGSVVIVTTRIPEVANLVKKPVDCAIEMGRLEGKDFMDFFETCIFSSQQAWEGHTELRDVGEKIVSKLKGFPLAAKTVGRLLKNQLTLEHWNRVLESKEWELQTNDNDIMPALKLSYDYLPFHLQQCFYYCALFPEDYEFNSKELVHLWIGLDIVQPCDLTKRIEDVGLCYLDDLVNHGFFKKNKRNNGSPCYVVHDLLHDLAVNISSFECLSISSSNVNSIHIRQDIRHLSIIIDNKDVEDVNTFKYYKNDLGALDKRLNVENLRTLMVFGGHHESFAKTFCDLFEKSRALRVIYFSRAPSHTMVDNMFNRFPRHIHLRYIRVKLAGYRKDIGFNLSALTRLYHLEVIDMQECKGRYGFTRHMNNLAKLRHFLVPQGDLQLHSNIVEVGKLKLLQELRRFEVGRDCKGFDLSQLGKLSELGESLSICSLERIRAMEEAHEARLIQKKHLHKLTLEWDANRPKKDITHEENVLEILTPCSNLRDLCIRGHGGTKCPKWLRENLSVKNLESLHLDGVSWNIFPPIGELWLVNGPHEEISSNEKFHKLKRLELANLPRLENWVVNAPCDLFADLEVLIIRDCSELTKISFSHSNCCHRERVEEANLNWFPRSLQKLKIASCRKLLSIPPVPWTNTLCSTKIEGVALGFNYLVCRANKDSEYCLNIEASVALNDDGTFWNVLDFDNLTLLKELVMDTCPPLPVHHFQVLSSLKTLKLFGGSSIVFPLVKGVSRAEYQFPAECIEIKGWNASAKEMTQLLTYFHKLSELHVWSCNQITGLAVVEKLAAKTPTLESSDNNKVDDQQEGGTRGKEEISASSAEELLLLPSQLQQLGIYYCRGLSLRSSAIDHNRELGRTGGDQWLQGLRSLRLLEIKDCPRFLYSYSSSSSSSCFPFPTSLERLSLEGVVGPAMPVPLSNLASLTDLTTWGCGDFRVKGLPHLLAQVSTRLTVRYTPNFFSGPEPPPPYEQEFPSSSSKLQELQTDDVASVLAAPICTLLSSSLTELRFDGDNEVERFTKEQEDALQLLTSLKQIICDKLQWLPAGLHGLPNLKRLSICECPAIRSLPKDGLPSSLQELEIDDCPAIQSLPKDCLPTSLQKLVIMSCPAIQSLPKDCLPSSLQKLWICDCPAIRSLPKVNDLPSSLRELHVRGSRNEELRRQCRKLIGIIPVVYA